jgi:signal transduction histidine kinase
MTRQPQRAEFVERVPVDRWFEAFINPVRLPNSVGAAGELLLITFNDLTPLRRVEEMRADFVANASHELRTPLAALTKRVLALGGEFPPPKLIRGVEHMTDLLLAQLKQVLNAYARRDDAEAMAVWRADEEIDAVCTSVFRELLTYMMEDPRNISFCIHLLFCAKNIERMGDHATNIAETVHYVIQGRPITDQRPKGDTTGFASLRAAGEA